jgi:hypothetical protein
MQTDCELTDNALVNDGNFVVKATIESGLEWSDTDRTTGWVGGVTVGNGSVDSSTWSVRLESSAWSVFNEGNRSASMMSEEERIVNSIEGIGGLNSTTRVVVVVLVLVSWWSSRSFQDEEGIDKKTGK